MPTLFRNASARAHASSNVGSTGVLIWAGVPAGAQRIACRTDNGRGQGGKGLSQTVSCTELQLKQQYLTARPGLPQGSLAAVTVIG